MHDAPPPSLLTERVRDGARDVAAALEAAGVAHGEMPTIGRLERAFALSPYVMETCRRRPEALARLLGEGALGRDGAPREALLGELRADAGGASEGRDEPSDGEPGEGAGATLPEPAQLALLRAFRHRHMLRILWRELDGTASLDATLADLTALAEACIIAATGWAEAAERRRAGTPRDEDGREQRLIVLGMGKLGGGELNVSSDIDLIYLWPAAGRSDGRRALDNGELFGRVARRLTRLLGSVTVDGFAFRVDTRLRPFGDSGPPAMHLDAFEHYLLTQGRGWERYAMIKARAITGEVADIEQLEALLHPFVYRRYIDYDALVALAELKGKIGRAVAARRDGADDIKLGPGGIREVEFTGQAFQLLRGGRERRLQRRPIREVLTVLGELGMLPPEEARAMIDAYEYLRRVENALQGMRDEQTHVLPRDADDRLRLVAMLGASDWQGFRATLEAHRGVVRQVFEAVLADSGGEPDGVSGPDVGAGATAGGRAGGTGGRSGEARFDGADPEATAAWLERAGIPADAALLERFAGLSEGPFFRRLGARAQGRVERILPRLIEAATAGDAAPTGAGPAGAEASGGGEAGVALGRALGFVRAVAGRSGYVQALVDRPAALLRLVRLFGASAWVAELTTRHPIVVDELLGEAALAPFGDAATIRAEAMAEAARLADADLERQMDALRHFRQTRELRIAAAALDGRLPPMRASDRLSWLAEATIAAALELVAAPVAERYGRDVAVPGQGAADAFGVSVVAYGKLGGLELGFGSDLDLVFLRDESEDGEVAARLVRRFVHFMGTMTPAGRVHEIDLRLRPNGNSGVLVGTLESFARYQREQAWTWEHQALLRARFVFGAAAARERFEALRREVLCTPRGEETLRADVAAMRERMRAELGDGREGVMHLKQDAGGIADIEFIVQYLALAHAARHPSLVRFTDNVRVLEEAGRLELLPAADADALAADYVELRERLHRRALDLADAVVPLDAALAALARRVVGHRERILGPSSDPD